MTLPYTPHDILGVNNLPSFVIEAINHLLIVKSRNVAIYFTLNEFNSTVNTFNTNHIPFNQSWYDFPAIYNKIGWRVEYIQKDANFGNPYWVFGDNNDSHSEFRLRLDKVLKDIAYYEQRGIL